MEKALEFIGFLIGKLLRFIFDLIVSIIHDTKNRPQVITGFPLESRFEHTHVLGGSGHGKTQLLQQLILNDIDALKENKGSIIVIDSQGDMIGKILYLADMKELSDRLILIDPSDIEHPPALNPPDYPHVAVQQGKQLIWLVFLSNAQF